MCELNEQIWAVLTERGIVASSITYNHALQLQRELVKRKVEHAFIVTNAAARREINSRKGTSHEKSHH